MSTLSSSKTLNAIKSQPECRVVSSPFLVSSPSPSFGVVYEDRSEFGLLTRLLGHCGGGQIGRASTWRCLLEVAYGVHPSSSSSLDPYDESCSPIPSDGLQKCLFLVAVLLAELRRAVT